MVRCVRALIWLLILPTAACAAEQSAWTIAPFLPEVAEYRGVGMAPLSPLADVLGATVRQDQAGITLTVEKRQFTVRRDRRFTCRGARYVPLRACVTALGGAVRFDAAARTVAIALPPTAPFTLRVGPSIGKLPDYTDDDEELYALQADGRRLRRLTYDSDTAQTFPLPSFSCDGSMLVYSRRGSLFVRAVRLPWETPLQVEHRSFGLQFVSPTFSPDGQTILCGLRDDDQPGDPYIALIHRARDQLLWLRRGDTPSFNRQGTRIVFAVFDDRRGTSVICTVDADGNDEEVEMEGMLPVFSPDGGTILYTERRLDAAAGNDPAARHEPNESDAAFAPDGRQYVVTKDGVGIFLRDMADETERQLTAGTHDGHPCYAPDGKQIFFVRNEALYIMDADGARQRCITRQVRVRNYRVTPDGRHLLLLAVPR